MGLNKNVLSELRALQVEGEPDFLKKLITIFMATSPERIDGIRLSITEERWSDVKAGAHSLRSSSLTLGAEKVAALCTKLESAQTKSVAEELFKSLQVEFSQVEAELKHLR